MSDENTNYEAEARQMGWAPQENFRGDPAKFVDAKTFVERGKTVLPILQENNRRLQADLSILTQRMSEMQELVLAGQESMEELKKFNKQNVERAVTQERERLTLKLADARENGTAADEVAIFEEITKLNTPTKKADEPTPIKKQPASPVIDPEFIAWQSLPENAWFGVDKKKTALAVGIADELRSDPKNKALIGRAFYNKISEEMEAFLEPPQRQVDRVEGNRISGSGGGSGKTGKSYTNLPPEAKEVCDNQEKKLVGKGRAFQTQAEWRAHYAEQYFRGE